MLFPKVEDSDEYLRFLHDNDVEFTVSMSKSFGIVQSSIRMNGQYVIVRFGTKSTNLMQVAGVWSRRIIKHFCRSDAGELKFHIIVSGNYILLHRDIMYAIECVLTDKEYK